MVGAEGEGHARVAQVRIVEGLKGIEPLGILLRCTVAPEQVPVEVDAHLRHPGKAFVVAGSRQLDAREQVLLGIGARLSYGQLASREDDRLGEVHQHEAQGRRGIGHRVGPVQDDKPVVGVIAVGHNACQPCPMLRIHVAGVQWMSQRIGVHLGIERAQLVEVVHQMTEVKRLQRPCLRIASHTYGASRIDEQHPAQRVSRSRVLPVKIVHCPCHATKLGIFSEAEGIIQEKGFNKTTHCGGN